MPAGFALDSMWEWMGWNLFLAAIPYVLSLYLFSKKNKHYAVPWNLGFFIFILFMPNAPYVITDTMHLFFNPTARAFNPTLAIFLFLGFELLGIYLFVKSYQRFENYFYKRTHLGKYIIRIISFVVLSIGVYLGRFPRLNSWDIVRPLKIIEGVVSMFSIHGAIYITLFAILLWLIFFLYEQLDTRSSKISNL